ncbi:hypothetical protein [Mesorhizobium sp. CN2-181]|uniref:hypothetical protein n=1 Tax=Mesorhizobium yinganensis TaxID=3157707 RepID=UPI0032B723E8
MAVDNALVRMIIEARIAAELDDGSCCGKYFSAWKALKAWRDQPPGPGEQPNSLDLNVAAAENYMFARAMVCAGRCSRFQMNTLALGYYATKLMRIGMPTSGNPQSEPDAGVAGWGGIGSEEGEADHDRCNAGVNPPYWRPVKEIFGKEGYYHTAVGTPGTRYDGS